MKVLLNNHDTRRVNNTIGYITYPADNSRLQRKQIKNIIMIKNWFECKVRYEKMMENGMKKKVTEPYLVDALSFTEAEARIIEEMTPFMTGEFTITAIARAKFSEVFHCEDDAADKWFKCKVEFITLDEKSGAEKKTATMMLVQAADVVNAQDNLVKGMAGTMADYVNSAVVETKIMDVYEFESNSN